MVVNAAVTSYLTCSFLILVVCVPGSLEAYLRVSSKLKLGTVEDEYTIKMNLSTKSGQGTGETDMAGQMKTG